MAKQTTTLDQKRAAHAAMSINRIKAQNPEFYISYVSSLPAVIVMNGLGQALLTERAKARGTSNAHQLLYTHVTDWLGQQIPELSGDNIEFIDRLVNQDQTIYLRAQAEAMAYLRWLKQFARAYLTESTSTDKSNYE